MIQLEPMWITMSNYNPSTSWAYPIPCFIISTVVAHIFFWFPVSPCC